VAGRRELRSPRGARAALLHRSDVQAVLAAALAHGVTLRLVGGAVRDAFLGRPGGDLDLAVRGGEALPFAGELARSLGTRPVPIGRPGARVIRVPAPPGEIDVWETGGSWREDQDRRDFTLNALSFSIPGWRLDGPAGALADLAAHRLRPTREGVLLEDPLRVLRAARFSAEMPGLSVSRSAIPELRRAAPLLAGTAPERRLAEMDRIFTTSPARAAGALSSLERWGALQALLPGSTPAERLSGIRRVARLPRGAGAAAGRVALVAPLGRDRALAALEEWKAPNLERRMASRILALSQRLLVGKPRRADIALAARAVAPFVSEAGSVLLASPSDGARRLGEALRNLSPAVLGRILRPPRPLGAGEVSALLGLPEGPALGRALAAMDEAVASGRVRTPAGARRLLEGLFREGD
jgi:hypothetical protein